MRRGFLLTGASSELGVAIAEDAVKSGWNVALCGHSRSPDAERIQGLQEGAACRAFSFDLRDTAAVDVGVAEALAFLGTCDAVVLAHGVTHQALLAETDDDDWAAVVDTNLTGSFRVVRAVLPEFVSARTGAFLFISSTAAYGLPGAGAYAASKAGLHGLSSTLAKEYGSRGIRSNVLACGAFSTGMFARTHDAEARKATARSLALGRLGEPADLARVATFLVSSDARYLTSQIIDLDGGQL